MQKVITITGNTIIQAGEFSETMHPELNKLLNDGYIIKETISVVPTSNHTYSITFILDSPKKITAVSR
jgi:hypothetical protein